MNINKYIVKPKPKVIKPIKNHFTNLEQKIIDLSKDGITYENLSFQLYGSYDEYYQRSLKVHVSNIRKKKGIVNIIRKNNK